MSPPPRDPRNDHMVIRVTATKAKASFLALLDEEAADNDVEITRRGRTVARGSCRVQVRMLSRGALRTRDEMLITHTEDHVTRGRYPLMLSERSALNAPGHAAGRQITFPISNDGKASRRGALP